MRPVIQTVHGPKGNCFEACVASIVECELEEVPELVGDNWADILRSWLKSRGWTALFYRRPRSKGYAIVSQKSPIGYVHAVVYLDGKIIHDPAARSFHSDRFQVVLCTVLRKTK